MKAGFSRTTGRLTACACPFPPVASARHRAAATACARAPRGPAWRFAQWLPAPRAASRRRCSPRRDRLVPAPVSGLPPTRRHYVAPAEPVLPAARRRQAPARLPPVPRPAQPLPRPAAVRRSRPAAPVERPAPRPLRPELPFPPEPARLAPRQPEPLPAFRPAFQPAPEPELRHERPVRPAKPSRRRPVRLARLQRVPQRLAPAAFPLTARLSLAPPVLLRPERPFPSWQPFRRPEPAFRLPHAVRSRQRIQSRQLRP